jgi:Mg2+-importing ATPase
MYLPFSPLANVLGFTPLPFSFFVFVAIATLVYLLLVEAVKRILLHRATHKTHPNAGGRWGLRPRFGEAA